MADLSQFVYYVGTDRLLAWCGVELFAMGLIFLFPIGVGKSIFEAVLGTVTESIWAWICDFGHFIWMVDFYMSYIYI